LTKVCRARLTGWEKSWRWLCRRTRRSWKNLWAWQNFSKSWRTPWIIASHMW
jgi:hypothetical protein